MNDENKQEQGKICNKCKQSLPVKSFSKQNYTTLSGIKTTLSSQCKKCRNKFNKFRYLENPEKYRKIKHDLYYSNKEKYKLAERKRYKKNPEKHRESAKKAYHKRRLLVLNHYGNNDPKCVCCGESHLEFLALDHKDDNGSFHRKLANLKGDLRHIYG